MLHVVHILEATTGGTRRHLRELALGLAPASFRQDVIISLRRDPAFAVDLPLFRERGIGVHVVPMRRQIAPLADLQALRRIRVLLRELRPDIVHTHSSKAGFLGRLAARRAGIRTVVHTPHAFAFLDPATPFRNRCYRWLERMAVPWTTRLIAVSEEERQLALDLGFAQAQVARIANGIAGPASSEPRTQISPPAAPTVLFLGRLCRQKAPDLLVAAIPEILRQVPEARFRLVGEGAWRGTLEREVARQAWHERVTFATACNEPEVAAELAAATVLAMPSRWEGLPYTLLEALQAGLPVVAADVGGVRDVAADTRCAVLVPPYHPASLAAGVVAVLRSPADRDRLAAAGRARVAHFTLTHMLEQTAAVYRAAAGGEADV
jgi:glycosyltransferase involved in cell wall biosynthesis